MLQTKEHGSLPWPGSDDAMDQDGTVTLPVRDLATARARLAEEWELVSPSTPDQIAVFYERSALLGADLDAWHATPSRQLMTDMLLQVAQQSAAHTIVDIGCGAGHDLQALKAARPDALLCGVEPNDLLREEVLRTCACTDSVALAPLETADLLVCVDVLEHLPDPEGFLSWIAEQAPVGCLLFEATASFDAGTPLHLPQNRGWRPGRCLEQHGWEVVDRVDRVHVWRRASLEALQHTGLLLCAYRSVNAATLESIIGVCAGPNPLGWRLRAKHGDGMISRSRGILVTDWWRSTADDVCLFVDDDVAFDPADADRLVRLCREGYDIIVGAYPVHNGGHLACRFLPGTGAVQFGVGASEEPLEIMYGATGFMALHRRVVDALIRDLPLLHGDQPWSYHNIFPFLTVANEVTGTTEVLSEDWSLCEMARRAGFRVWLDPAIILRHASTIDVTIKNMDAIHGAIT